MDTTKVGVATRLSLLEACKALLSFFSECSQRNLISMKVPLLRGEKQLFSAEEHFRYKMFNSYDLHTVKPPGKTRGKFLMNQTYEDKEAYEWEGSYA
jgi:hypothetical protein